jgi:uncharacterized repeat protein (TIGR03803 family)
MFHVCNKKMCTDGDKPFAGMIASKGMLYGTTALGGPGAILHQGTVFAFDPKSSRETVLYSFCSKTDCADGAFPQSELIDVKGTLYGTTAYGGGGPVGACDIYNYYYGCGVVFSLDTATGTEKMLYAFCSKSNCADGGLPQAGLVQTNGILYGTTSQGGDTGCGGGRGCGTVFALDLGKGTLKVLHAFQGGTDGADPYGRLISVNGTLYGTTLDGGDTACNCGTVFSLDPGTGAEKVLYSFLGDRIDGAGPYAGLINVMGTLYGTTYGGGKHNHGTAFSLKP